MEFETVIGLEIHAELNTKTKAFCSCPVTFGKEANTCCCPVCMGLPGSLPVLNKRVVEYAVKMGIATNCEINLKSQFARKNYFYPDLPKGYQISQGNHPICSNGYITINSRKIRINRIHMEEDAGKLIHMDTGTKIDYNRAGVPLIEIVTEPDMRSAEEAKAFMEKIKSILLYLEISECKMQEGNLRCDVNVSVREKGDSGYGERCEMKNINSFSAAVRSIVYEEKRQREIIKNGGMIKAETRRWDDEKGESVLLRDKETGADYRYFTEPDLPPVVIDRAEYIKIKSEMSELPHEKIERYKKVSGLSAYDAETVAASKYYARIFDETVENGANAKIAANFIMGDISRIVNDKGIAARDIPFTGRELAELVALIENDTISNTAAKEVLEVMFAENKRPCDIVKEKGFTQINDMDELVRLVKDVLLQNEKSAEDYRRGKKNALGFITGQCMKESSGRANPKMINEILIKLLEGEK